ncbi:MAG: alpha/beta hydrolase [Sneathiellaceae bacterium]
MEISHGFLHLDEVKLHYARCGEAGQPLMLFVHGFPEFWYMWRDLLTAFGHDHLAVAPDMRGYNLSDKPAEITAYAPKRLVADLDGLRRGFGAERFTLVAHDWGGAVAWAYAIAHPERLDRLVIINATHPATFVRDLLRHRPQTEASQYMRLFREPGAEAKLSADNYAWMWDFTFRRHHEAGLLGDAERDAYLAAWAQPGALTGGLNWYRATRMPVPLPEEADPQAPLPPMPDTVVRVPTLVLWGMQDHALLPGLLDGLEDYVPDLQVQRLPEASHWVMQEQPDTVRRAIRAFIDRPAIDSPA